MLVNENFDILQFRGETAPFFKQPPGEPTTSLLKLAREGLFLELRSALTEAKTLNQAVRRERVGVHGERSVREIKLRVLPIHPGATAGRCFLVLFEDAHFYAPAAPPMAAPNWLKRLQRWAGRSRHCGPIETQAHMSARREDETSR